MIEAEGSEIYSTMGANKASGKSPWNEAQEGRRGGRHEQMATALGEAIYLRGSPAGGMLSQLMQGCF